MPSIIGRETEFFELQRALASKEAELIAVYGRLGVGKTFLIREVYKTNLIFQFTGTQDSNSNEQLIKFAEELTRKAKSALPIKIPKNWGEAF